MKPTLIYCYDAYCSWCYGFSQVMRKVNSEYKSRLEFEVLSGGMILPDEPVEIGATAEHIKNSYKNVEKTTGIKFGSDYLWHINNPNMSDWFPHSEMPAIALCIFKDYYPDQQVSFVSDMQYALFFEGRDLTDKEAYRHLLEKYNINAEEFFGSFYDEQYKEAAHYEFALCKQLQVTGFPAVFIQVNDTKFHMVARGYTDYETISKAIEKVLQEVA